MNHPFNDSHYPYRDWIMGSCLSRHVGWELRKRQRADSIRSAAARCSLLFLAIYMLGAAPVALGAEAFAHILQSWTLSTGGNQLPTVFTQDFEHAWVHDPTLRPSINPPRQRASFDPAGTNFLLNNEVFNTGLSGPVSTRVNVLNVPAAGLSVSNAAGVSAPINSAEATTTINVQPLMAGSVSAIIGETAVAAANPGPVPSDAYAFSHGLVRAAGNQLNFGRFLQRLPFIETGSPSSSIHVSDPLRFTAIDLSTGEVLEGNLFEMGATLIGNGGISLSSEGLFSVDAADATFMISVDSPFIPVSQHGRISLVIENGLVTTSLADGIFGGFLPPVGSSGMFDSLLPDDGLISFDYNLGDFGGHPVDISITNAATGEVSISAVPEPPSIALLSLAVSLYGYFRRNGNRTRTLIER